MSIRVFGLTGGIGSGKSAVGACFRRANIPVIDADQLAREIVLPGTPGFDAIVDAFGKELVRADGTLDRGAMGKRVFSDPAALKMLNAITHPRINQRMLELAQQYGQEGHQAACYEAALIIENGAADFFRPLVVVVAPTDQRVARIVVRDKATEADARARMAAQMSDDARRAAADIVIENDGTLEALEERALAALANILKFMNITQNA